MTNLPCSIPGRRRLAQQIVADVAQRHNLIVRDLTGRDRFAHFVAARREAARALREAGLFVTEIGKALDRHHTTVLHYVEREGWRA
jgi:chromosomal replication initiation ATPase DnaA